MERPPVRLAQEVKESAIIDSGMEDDQSIKLLVDDAFKKYYNSYIKAFEVNWLKNEAPV